LEFISHPEGRLRPVRIDTTQAISIANLKYIYDYFLKDHLGSVRSVLTTEQQTDFYAATMETAAAAKEDALFTNVSATASAKPSGMTNDNNNQKASKLNGDVSITGNKRVGPAIVLKVMAGDTISLSTWSWYTGAVQPPASGVADIATELLPLLTGGVAGNGGTHGGAIPASTSDPLLSTALSHFLSNNRTYVNTRPKAFLNWMVVDEEFAGVSSPNHLGATQIPVCNAGDTLKAVAGPVNMVIRRNGWIYIYLSNESAQDVYFDNLVVNLRHGPLLEVNDYYPFGMQIPGLSTQSYKYQYNQNRYKYNGIEYDTAFGLDEYEAHYRDLDPQIGRWWQIDPKPDYGESPYSSMGNNPILHNDPLGDTLDFPDASPEFIGQFYDAFSYLDAHGVSDVLTNLQRISAHINVRFLIEDDGNTLPSEYNPDDNTIYWNPMNGATEGSVTISPATVLAHESDHALQFKTHPKQYAKDTDPKTGADRQYDNKEERRVTTGQEQRVARALGEIKKGQVTRRNHQGHNTRVSGPTSTQSVSEKNMFDLLKREQEFKKLNPKVLPQRKIPCIGCDGPRR